MRPADRRHRASIVVALVAATSLSCVSSEFQSRDWSAYDGPGAEYFHAEEVEFPYVDDPIEPVNRISAKLGHEFLLWVVAPLANVYRFLTPHAARVHVAKAGTNWQFPTRFLNNLLQGKLRRSGVETLRFALNTTVGVLGLFDPAQGWGLHPYPEDFGQTFATWGWKPSTYFFLPLLGPRTTRDTLAEIPDALSDPATYYFPASVFRAFNSLSDHIEADLRTVQATYDAYEPARTLYTLTREIDVDDFEWHADESGPTQTLRAIFLEPVDPTFAERATNEVTWIDEGREKLPYSLWLQPEPGPLMYVVPGFGGHRFGAATLALAEIAFEHGHSVVAVSSPTNWEFMRFGASVTVPGFGPVDAHDLHSALTAVDRDLVALYPDRFRERRICGVSLGAYELLLIAAGEDHATTGERAVGLLEFDRYLALNPPVSFEHALRQLDRFYNTPLTFAADERAERIEEIFAKVLYLSDGDLEPGMELPFTELESRFLIGLAFRLDLQFLILQSQELFDSGVLLTQRARLHMAPAFREVAAYSFMEFFYAFVLPYYAERDPAVDLDEAGGRALFERSDLSQVGGALRDRDSVRVFTNENDFLLRPEDVAWLQDTLGERLTLFEDGGHLGNLYREYLRSMIARTIEPGP